MRVEKNRQFWLLHSRPKCQFQSHFNFQVWKIPTFFSASFQHIWPNFTRPKPKCNLWEGLKCLPTPKKVIIFRVFWPKRPSLFPFLTKTLTNFFGNFRAWYRFDTLTYWNIHAFLHFHEKIASGNHCYHWN